MRYRFADYELDTERYTLLREGAEVSLEPKALQLLIALLEKHPAAATKDELLDALWPDATVSEGSLTRAAHALRRVLQRETDDPAIVRTVRGRGYAIGVDVARHVEREEGPTGRVGTATSTELRAIVSADVVGYTRHIEHDRANTAVRMGSLRGRAQELVADQRGRLEDFKGDCFMAIFPSAEDAVNFALGFQSELREQNRTDETARPLEFRIGIHLGDVRIDEGGVYGSGVNVAARLQGLAKPGGICVSDAIYEQVRSIVDAAWEHLGPRDLKNIDKPVVAHRTGSPAVTNVPTEAAPIPGLPSRQTIAVLPFQNLSGEPDEEYFADGIAEDLITALAARRYYPVIARNSTFSYKGRSVDVREVGRDLGASYVIEGSVRRAGERLRVAVQLLNAETGHHLWATRYDREIGDVFGLQDEIVADVFAAIEPELRRFAPTPRQRGDVDVWELERRAFWNITRRTDASTAEALACCDRALALDPESVLAHTAKAIALSIRVSSFWEPDRGRLGEAAHSARTAITLDRDNPWPRGALGDVLLLLGRPAEARPEIERAIALDPSSAIAYCQLARALVSLGEYDDAVDNAQRALQLSPRDPLLHMFFNALAQAQFGAGRYEESLTSARRSLGEHESALACCLAAACAGLLGRREDCHELIARARQIVPGLRARQVEAFLAEASVPEDFKSELLRGLRLAGLSGASSS